MGGTQAKVYIVASGASGRVSPHINFGYTFSGESDIGRNPLYQYIISPPDELNYTGGLDVVIRQDLTFAAGLVGRTLRGSELFGRLIEAETGFQDQNGAAFREFKLQKGVNLNLLLGTAGFKFAPGDRGIVIASNLLFPVN